jgi:hypothetical protein
MQWMATSKTAQRLPGSTPNAMDLNCLKCIIRTRRGKPACRRQPGRNYQLINTDDGQADDLSNRSLHNAVPRSASNSVCSSPNSLSQAERRGFSTTSKPDGRRNCAVRMISRTLLLIRFLSCAAPSFRGVVSPKRLCSRPFTTVKTTKERDTFFAPLL